jgi:hypothetical protein
MSYRSGVLTGLLISVLAAAALGAAWWTFFAPPAVKDKPKPPEPAQVSKAPREVQINTLIEDQQVNVIVLTAEGVERLALRTEPIRRKPMHRARQYGGDVVLPPGQSLIVSAPLNGTLQQPGETPLAPGSFVNRGQPIFELMPLLTPEGRANLNVAKIDAEGQVQTASVQVEATLIALDRARRVFESEAGSRRAPDEAQALHDIARRTHEAAIARRELLNKVVGEVEKGTTSPIEIVSPRAGVLQNLSAQPGQSVASGATLFEIADLSRVWVRVPVYVGDLAELDTAADAVVSELTGKPHRSGSTARPVTAPPSADADAGTIDLYYALENRVPPLELVNRVAEYHPGERVAVRLPLKDEPESLTIAWSAVIHDIHGGTWVYEQTAERTYVRRRVVVRHAAGDTAVLASGPPPGTRIVTAGTAELFGTETGFTK